MPIKPAFSAIELLLVAGISAILVAIAVPGYLDAKVRAEVTDVNVTLREVHSALIQYHLDFNQFPEAPTIGAPHPLLRLVNTEKLPKEPFDRFKKGLRDYGGYYMDPYIGFDYLNPKSTVYKITTARMQATGLYDFKNSNSYQDLPYYIKSIGPDQTDFRDEGGGRTSNKQSILGLVPYDPTNGTYSLGEIVRFKPD